jgi:hypothetical protein
MSKADLASFCLKVQKQLNMPYVLPSLPVALNRVGLDDPKETTLQVKLQLTFPFQSMLSWYDL